MPRSSDRCSRTFEIPSSRKIVRWLAVALLALQLVTACDSGPTGTGGTKPTETPALGGLGPGGPTEAENYDPLKWGTGQ